MALVTEQRGGFASHREYVAVEGTDQVKLLELTGSLTKAQIINQNEQRDKLWSRSWSQQIQIAFRQVFLPHGYPNSVSKDYLTYQKWDTVQAFASSITGSLATEAVMKGVGVGSETATPLAAALTWLLKNGSGHIGQIIFAWAKGTSLDYDSKKWRMFADALNDLATFIDLIAPIFAPEGVVFVLCTASVARSLVGVAGSATRAAVTQHQARSNNMADVSAKDGSQETLVNLMALISSLILLPLVSGNLMAVWSLYLLFTGIHLFANYKAVSSLEIESFNKSRLLIAINQYLGTGHVPSVREVNMSESVILGLGINEMKVCGYKIRLGVSFDHALRATNGKRNELEKILRRTSSKPFIIIPNVEESIVNVILHENIQPQYVLEAYATGVMWAKVSQSSEVKIENPYDMSTKWNDFKEKAKAKGKNSVSYFLRHPLNVVTGERSGSIFSAFA